MPEPSDNDHDLALALMTIKLLVACFTDLAAAFTAIDREAAEKAIAGVDKGVAEALRNLWGECAQDVNRISDIDALLTAINKPSA